MTEHSCPRPWPLTPTLTLTADKNKKAVTTTVHFLFTFAAFYDAGFSAATAFVFKRVFAHSTARVFTQHFGAPRPRNMDGQTRWWLLFWLLIDVIVSVLLKPNHKEYVREVSKQHVNVSKVHIMFCHIGIVAGLLMALPWPTHTPCTCALRLSREVLATRFPQTYPYLFSVMTYWPRMCFGNACYWSPPLSVFRASCPACLIPTRS